MGAMLASGVREEEEEEEDPEQDRMAGGELC